MTISNHNPEPCKPVTDTLDFHEQSVNLAGEHDDCSSRVCMA